MARPRIFISSTFYDLRYVREDLDIFIRGLGYDPIRHEAGGIAYGSKDAPEKYAYKEVELCDVLVCVIGGRYGTEAREGSRSITQTELKHALEHGIQVFILIEQTVYTEFQTYLLNKANTKTKYKYADDNRIFEFIEHLHSLPNNNPITTFSTSKQIIDFLRDQWAGLFQRFLSDQRRMEEIHVLSEMKSISSTLQQLVDYLSSEAKDKDTVIKDILLSNHPAFKRFASLTGTTYRVFFPNRKDLDSWLSARGFKAVEEDAYDTDSIREWCHNEKQQYLKLTHEIFDKKGKLIPFTEEEWKDSWVSLLKLPEEKADDPDDIPFQ